MAYAATRRRARRIAGRCRSATTSPPTSATSHPREKLAMVHEHYDGRGPRGRLGRAPGPREPGRARARVRSGWGAATASPWCCRRRPETAALFFGDLEARGAPALDVGALRRRRHPPPADRLAPAVLVTDAANAAAFEPARAARARARRPHLRRRSDRVRDASTPRPTTRPSSTTRPARPASRRASSTRTATCSAHEEFDYCHDVQDGERFHGMGEWAWAAGICAAARPVAARRGAVRLPARGRL